jgi:hypothetical protein
MRPEPLPLRPDPHAMRRMAVASLARACVSIARGADTAQEHVTRTWPRDDGALAVVKAVSAPSDTTSASPLVRQIIPALIEALGPASAGAVLLGASLSLRFDTAGSISVPSITADPGLAQFVGQGAPLPVAQGAFAPPVVLTPRKLGAVLTLTSEMASASNAEAILSDLLTRSTALALDTALFSSNAGTAVAPPGLRNGINPLTASADPDPLNAMLADIEKLITVTAAITAEPPILVMSPSRAIMAQLRAPHTLAPLRVLASAALAPADVLCVAPIALANATGDAPRVEEARDATVHMENVPLAIIDGSGTLAMPTRSLWQTDSIGLRVIYPADWALRDVRGCSWLTATAW